VNVEATLKAAGATLANIVEITLWPPAEPLRSRSGG
jgi:hypothetical protein